MSTIGYTLSALVRTSYTSPGRENVRKETEKENGALSFLKNRRRVIDACQNVTVDGAATVSVRYVAKNTASINRTSAAASFL